MATYGPDTHELTVHTKRGGAAAKAGHDLMVDHARQLGANAVVGLRFDASEVASKFSATEVLCYGTAVVIEPIA